MDIQTEVLRTLDEVLALNGRTASFTGETALHGNLIELDSMAVVSLMAVLEERFAIAIEDSEIDAAIFATVDSLVRYVAGKLRTDFDQRSSAIDSEYR